MATKTTRKSTAVTTTSSFSSPQTSGGASSTPRPGSPLSPTRYSRLQEKVELQNLNDRLACYIDKVRSLEIENSRLTREVQISEEHVTQQINSVKMLYDQELNDARKFLDETSKEKTKVEIEVKRLWEENDDLKKKLDKKTRDLQNLERIHGGNEHRLNELQIKYNQASSDKKKLEEELKDLKKEHGQLLDKFEIVKNQLSAETVSRIEVENTLQSLKEDVNFKEQMYHKEITKVRTRRQEELSEIDGRLAVEYEDKLQKALQELRDQHEQQLRVNREEISNLYEHKIASLQGVYERNSHMNKEAIHEAQALRSTCDSLRVELSSLEKKNSDLTSRVRELEKLLEDERARQSSQLAELELELNKLREEMSNQLRDYQDLMDIKVVLDTEISAYRKLLECEENRLNITPMASPVHTQVTRRGTPYRGTPVPRAGSKRKRTVLEESEQQVSYKVNAESKGDVEISEVDVDGKYVKLYNKGNKEISLAGWSLKHKAGEQEITFKFHRTLKIDHGVTITVWSSDSGHEHGPPENIVIKQKFPVGDTSRTAVVNNEGEEVATSQRERVVSARSSAREEWGEFEDVQNGDSQSQESCRLM